MKNQNLRLFALLCLVTIFGCRDAQTNKTSNLDDGSKQERSALNGKPLRYLALGDSYTIGESVAETDRWPIQLTKKLKETGVAIDEPQIIAVTGWTTDELMAGIKKTNPKGPFDLVTLLIGVNNQFRGRPVEEYRKELRELLATSSELAGGNPGKVILLSIPDWGVTPFAKKQGKDPERIAGEIDQYNAAKKEEAEKMGMLFVDITSGSRMAQDDATLLASDGLHPSGKMYEQWAAAAINGAIEVLSGKRVSQTK